MSGFPVPPRQEPGSHETAPWDFTTFLQKTADQRQVTLGPGGAAVVIQKDTLFAPPPSQEGIGGAKEKLSVKTNDPKLDEPMFAGLGLWSMQFATTIVNILIGTMKETPDTLTGLSLGESLAATLAYREEALHQALVEEGLISPETVTGELSFGQTSLVGGKEGVAEGMEGLSETNANAAFFAWFQSLANTMSAQLPILSPQTQLLLTNIGSTDIKAVRQQLIEMANLSSLDLSPAQQTLLFSKLDVIATGIAAANEEGGAFVLNMTVPGVMLPVFMETVDMSTDTTMTADDKSKLSLALLNICNQLASANFQKVTSLKAPPPEFTALVSSDPQQVGMLLSTIVSTMQLPSGVSNKDLIAVLNTLTASLCALSPQDMETLQSIDKEGLAALFSQALDSAQAAGLISAEVHAQLLTTLIPLLVDKTASINQIKLTGDLSSKDPTEIQRSLTFLTGISSDKKLNKASQTIVMTYIQALISALVYLSNLRCLMLQMETEFTQALAETKVAGIDRELKIAEQRYTVELQKVMVTYEKNINSISTARFWRWFGPLLTVLLVLIITIVIVALAVATVVSGGAASPALVALVGATPVMVGAVVGAVAAVVSFVIVLADACCQWAKGKGMWKMLCEAMGATSELATSAIAMAFELLINIVAIILTFGTYAIVVVVKQAFQTAVKISLQVIVRQIMAYISKKLSEIFVREGVKLLAKQVAQIVMTCLFSSGFLTNLLKEIGEAMMKDGNKAGIFAMVMTIVFMVLGIILTGKMTPKGGWTKGTVTSTMRAARAGGATAAGRGIALGAARAAAQATKSTAPAKDVAGMLNVAAKGTAKVAGEASSAAAAAARTAGAQTAQVSKTTTTAMMKEFLQFIDKMKDELIKGLKTWWASLKKVPPSLVQRVDPERIRVIQEKAKEAQRVAQEQVGKWTKAVVDTSKERTLTVAIGEARALAGATGGLQSLRTMLVNIGKSFKNIIMNIVDHYGELMAIGSYGQGLEKMEKVLRRLTLMTELLRLTRMSLQVVAAAMQYEAAKTEEYFHRLLAALAEDQAVLQAMSQFLNRLGGIDQTETIAKINESAQESFDNWVRLLQLVSDFIKDAGLRVSEMSSSAGM